MLLSLPSYHRSLPPSLTTSLFLPLSSPPRSCHYYHPARAVTATLLTATPLVPSLPPRSRRHCPPARAATATPFRAITATPLALSLAQRVPYLPCVATCLADITAHGCLECGSCGSSAGGEAVGWVLRTGRRVRCTTNYIWTQVKETINNV